MPMSPDEKSMLRAAKGGDVDAARELLAANPALIGVLDTDGSTPLHCAAWKGHAEVVSMLLDAGADIMARNQNDHWGDTPLHAAAHGNQKAVVELLLARGADVYAVNPAGRTPLQETEFHNATAAAKLLRAHVG